MYHKTVAILVKDASVLPGYEKIYLNLDMVVVKQTDSSEKVDRELQKIAEKARQERMQKLEPFFGILKDKDIDPLKLQKKWRSDWE